MNNHSWSTRSNLFQLFAKINNYREAGRFTDVKILVGEQIFHCNRIILASSCEYFEKMFVSKFQESQADVLELKDIEPEIFEIILNFIYMQKLKINKANAFELLRKGNLYTLLELERRAMNYIRMNGKCMENLLEICDYVYSIGDEKFLCVLAEIVADDFGKYSKMENFVDIPFRVLQCILLLCESKKKKKFSDTQQYDEDNKKTEVNRGIVSDQEIEANMDSKDGEEAKKDKDDKRDGNVECDAISNPEESEKVMAIINWLRKDAQRASHLPQLSYFVKLPEEFKKTLMNTFLGEPSLLVFQATTSHLSKKSNEERVISVTLAKNSWIWKKDICRRSVQFRVVAAKREIFFMTYTCDPEKHISVNNFFVDEPTRRELLPPPVIASDYSLCATETSIFLYNYSEQFTISSTPATAVGTDKILNFKHTSTIFEYQIETNKWFVAPEVLFKLYNSYMVCWENKLYMIGGFRIFPGQEKKARRRNVVQIYDTLYHKWTRMGNIPETLDFSLDGAACAFNDHIYICERSANSKDPSTRMCANVVLVYDIKKNDWLMHKINYHIPVPLPTVMLPFKTQLWLFAFSSGTRGVIFDPKERKWDVIPTFPETVITANDVSKLINILGAVVYHYSN